MRIGAILVIYGNLHLPAAYLDVAPAAQGISLEIQDFFVDSVSLGNRFIQSPSLVSAGSHIQVVCAVYLAGSGVDMVVSAQNKIHTVFLENRSPLRPESGCHHSINLA